MLDGRLSGVDGEEAGKGARVSPRRDAGAGTGAQASTAQPLTARAGLRAKAQAGRPSQDGNHPNQETPGPGHRPFCKPLQTPDEWLLEQRRSGGGAQPMSRDHLTLSAFCSGHGEG